jgi:uncharacterized phiE125 gp8 family phage protein
MALSLVTAPTSEPITTAEAKLHLRVEHDVDNPWIERAITTAQAVVETAVGRKFGSQTWDEKRDGTPCGDTWELPFPPVSSVTSITYVDTAGTTQTWSSAQYTVDSPAGDQGLPTRIVPAYGYSWPVVRSVPNAITVRFVCGYTTVPAALKAAMLVLIEHWYANRGAVVIGTVSAPLEYGFNFLTYPYKSIAAVAA